MSEVPRVIVGKSKSQGGGICYTFVYFFKKLLYKSNIPVAGKFAQKIRNLIGLIQIVYIS